MYRPTTASLPLLLVLLCGIASCDGAEEQADALAALADDSGLLGFVPDDTPYLFVIAEPMPDDVQDKFEPHMDRLLASYRTILRTAARDALEEGAAADAESELERERTAAVIDELTGFMSGDALDEAGIDRDATLAFYGVGLLPVLRVTLSDAAAFEAALDRVETRAGTPMATGEVRGVTFRSASADGIRLLLAVIGDHAVATLVPAGLEDGLLAAVLGVEPPATSIAASGRLRRIAEDNGYTAHGAGFVDIARLVATFVEAQDGVNAALLAAADYDPGALSDVCRDEIRDFAAIAPRMISGYTAVGETRIRSNSVLELRPDIAAGLATLTAPVPGLGADHGGLFSFGMSVDLLAAREFYAARLDALEADPWRCELFADVQNGVARGRAALEQPVPPVVYGLRGFLAIVDDIDGLDVAARKPPTSIAMRFLLATENAPGLLAMGTMFSPELAALDLQPDGEPVRFDAPQLQAPIDEAYVAMNDTALAVAVGEGGASGLKAMLAGSAGDPPPFLSMHMDAARYYRFVGDSMSSAPGDASQSAAMTAAVTELMANLGELFARMSMQVNFTDRGIEFPTTITLQD